MRRSVLSSAGQVGGRRIALGHPGDRRRCVSRRRLTVEPVRVQTGEAVVDCARLATPPELVSEGERLFDLQVWCFGQDVARLPGNGLVHFGFERTPPPPVYAQASSYYRWTGPAGEQVTLWSFGALYSVRRRGSVFLRRFDWTPRQSSGVRLAGPAWSPDEVRIESGESSASASETAQGLTLEFIAWLQGYERWVEATYSKVYRSDCIAKWNRGVSGSLVEAWRSLGMRLSSSWQEQSIASRAGEKLP